MTTLARLAEKVQQAKDDYEMCYGEACNRISIQVAVKNTHETVKGKLVFRDDFETPQQKKSMEQTQEADDHWSALNFNDRDVDEVIKMAEKEVEVGEPSTKNHPTAHNEGMCAAESVADEAKSFEISVDMGAIIPHTSPLMVAPVSHQRPIQYTVRLPESSLLRHWKTGEVFGASGVSNESVKGTFRHNKDEVPPVSIPDGAVVALPVTDRARGKGKINVAADRNPNPQKNTRTSYPGRAISSPFDGAKTDIERTITPLKEKNCSVRL